MVGAGVAGGVAAYHLASEDIPTLLVEKGSAPGERTVCGGAFHSHFAHKYHLPLPTYAVQGKFWTPQGSLIRSTPQFPYVVAPRFKLDALLCQKAVEKGAKLWTQKEIIQVEEGPRGCTLMTKDGKTLNSNYVILADGPQTLGRRFSLGYRIEKRTLIAHMAEIPQPTPPTRMDFVLLPYPYKGGYQWVFGKGDHANVGAGTFLWEAKKWGLKPLVKQFLLNQGFSLQHATFKGGFIPHKLARRLASSRLLVTGDAAGMVNPITGGGIHMAFIGGFLAAHAVHVALTQGEPLHQVYPSLIRQSLAFQLLKGIQCIFSLTPHIIPYPIMLLLYLPLLGIGDFLLPVLAT